MDITHHQLSDTRRNRVDKQRKKRGIKKKEKD